MIEGPYPNHLAEFMRASRLTDPSLARLLGISKQQVFNLRRGHRKLTVEWAQRLAPHLGVSWQELITGPPTAPIDQMRADWMAAYDAMSDEQRRAALVMFKVMVPVEKPDEKPPPDQRPKRRANG